MTLNRLHEIKKLLLQLKSSSRFPTMVLSGLLFGGSMVKNPLASAGDIKFDPGPGRSHMLQSN